jgi:hypothetical protein
MENTKSEEKKAFDHQTTNNLRRTRPKIDRQTLEPAQVKLEHKSLKLFVNSSPLRTRYLLEEFPSRINIVFIQE